MTYKHLLSKNKKKHVLNGRTDFLVTIIELLRFQQDHKLQNIED